MILIEEMERRMGMGFANPMAALQAMQAMEQRLAKIEKKIETIWDTVYGGNESVTASIQAEPNVKEKSATPEHPDRKQKSK
jgi:DNA-binding protein YbaB